MKISEILNTKETLLSFEMFPPKEDSDYDAVINAAERLSRLSPDFMSVTFGAGGGTRKNTISIASHIQNECGITALAHLTCFSTKKDDINRIVDKLGDLGVNNILALRGDPPKEDTGVTPDFIYASQLIEEIKRRGDFCVGGACYPDGHVECGNKEKDIDHLKIKVGAGCDFLITQMFFDNNVLYNFLYRLHSKGINVPVFAGIMPIMSANQIWRSVALSGTVLPAKHRAILDRYGDNPKALRQAGIAYAIEQIIDLISNGVRGIHIYTLNRPSIGEEIVSAVSELIRG